MNDVEGFLLLFGVPCFFVAGLLVVGVVFDWLLGPVDLSNEPEPYEARTRVMHVDPDDEDWAA